MGNDVAHEADAVYLPQPGEVGIRHFGVRGDVRFRAVRPWCRGFPRLPEERAHLIGTGSARILDGLDRIVEVAELLQHALFQVPGSDVGTVVEKVMRAMGLDLLGLLSRFEESAPAVQIGAGADCIL